MKKEISNSDNPLFFYNQHTEALDEAYEKILSAFVTVSEQQGIDKKQVVEYKELLHRIYLEKRVAYYLQSKLEDFNSSWDALVQSMYSLSRGTKSDTETNLFVLKSKKLIHYE